jgi:plastocyanin
VLAAALLLVMGCGAQTSAASSSGNGQSFTVNMTDANRFEPAELTVPKGSTVTWRNTGQVVHTVTDDPSKAVNKSDALLASGAQPWDSGTIPGGASFSHTFDVPGQYTYFCLPHESLGMVGHITVTE